MTYLTLEAKQAIVEKALNRTDKTLSQIAEENNIGCSTLSSWLSQTRQGVPLVAAARRVRPKKGQGQTPPLQHLLATEKFDEAAIGVYCREQGIHSFQLTKWKDELMKHSNNKTQASDELKVLRKENKNLKQDLRRKEKALAETSTLLVLKKKADLIWGESEDD